jgi:hypothetical protein
MEDGGDPGEDANRHDPECNERGELHPAPPLAPPALERLEREEPDECVPFVEDGHLCRVTDRSTLAQS